MTLDFVCSKSDVAVIAFTLFDPVQASFLVQDVHGNKKIQKLFDNPETVRKLKAVDFNNNAENSKEDMVQWLKDTKQQLGMYMQYFGHNHYQVYIVCYCSVPCAAAPVDGPPEVVVYILEMHLMCVTWKSPNNCLALKKVVYFLVQSAANSVDTKRNGDCLYKNFAFRNPKECTADLQWVTRSLTHYGLQELLRPTQTVDNVKDALAKVRGGFVVYIGPPIHSTSI